jgi:hypothetical protein
VRRFAAAGVALLGVAIALASCSSDEEDCLCTEYFGTITATLVDATSAPVEGAVVVVTRELDGSVLPFGGPAHSPGAYAVYDDSRTQTTRPGESIRISATKDALTFEGVIQVTVDLPCRCHVSKASGPDTLVAQ